MEVVNTYIKVLPCKPTLVDLSTTSEWQQYGWTYLLNKPPNTLPGRNHLVDGAAKPFAIVHDKGFCASMIAWKTGKQPDVQPVFTKSDEWFTWSDAAFGYSCNILIRK